MSTRDIGFQNERIERLLIGRTGGRRWRVTEAKTRFSEIIQHAQRTKAVAAARHLKKRLQMVYVEAVLKRWSLR